VISRSFPLLVVAMSRSDMKTIEVAQPFRAASADKSLRFALITLT
jgi:hypothetical protein